jgi:hypothetical protein
LQEEVNFKLGCIFKGITEKSELLCQGKRKSSGLSVDESGLAM